MVVLTENNVVVVTSDTYEEVSNGRLINGEIYPFGEVYVVEDPEEDIIPHKHCYEPEVGFYLNPLWLNTTDDGRILLLEESVLNLSTQVNTLTENDPTPRVENLEEVMDALLTGGE